MPAPQSRTPPAHTAVHGSRWERGIVLVYLAVLAVAEISVTWSVPIGVVCHGAALLVLLNHYVFASQTPAKGRDGPRAQHQLSSLPVLGLVPILRIASLTIPNNELSPIFWYALVVLPLALAVVLTARLIGAGPADLGIRWTRTQATIALIGVPLGFAAFEMRQTAPVIRSDDWRYLAVGAFIVLVFGCVEELVFRGMIQRSLCEVFGLGGILLTAALSAVAAAGSGSLSFVALSGGVAIVFGLLVDRTGSLVGVGFAHGIVNIMAIVLLANSSPLFGR